MIAFGPSIRPGVVLDRGNIVDEPATVARVLGIDMGDIDGKVLEELLK